MKMCLTSEQIKHERKRVKELTVDIVLAERMDLIEYAELCEHLQTSLLEDLMELSEQVCLVCV